MFRGLFARLTGNSRRGQPLFDLAVAEARKLHWFVEGEVPDTVSGRFAVLATIIALLAIRLEREGEVGRAATVALTERFVESLDAEIRQMGLSDPTLGKQVRRLVGAVSARVERWRAVLSDDRDWTGEVMRGVYAGEPPSLNSIDHSESELRSLWRQLSVTTFSDLYEGKIG